MTATRNHYQRDLPFGLAAGTPRAAGEAGSSLDPSLTSVRLHEALEELCGLAQAGSGPAALLIGRVLWSLEAAARLGVAWLALAASRGEAEASYLLALACFHGRGIGKDLAEARRLHAEAARRGIVDAQFELSLLLEQGLGGKRDPRGAARWEATAAGAGHPRACLNRGARAANRRHPDYRNALRWYRRAAAAGNSEAAARLSRMYLAGQGVAANQAVAKRWFERAAALGHDLSSQS